MKSLSPWKHTCVHQKDLMAMLYEARGQKLHSDEYVWLKHHSLSLFSSKSYEISGHNIPTTMIAAITSLNCCRCFSVKTTASTLPRHSSRMLWVLKIFAWSCKQSSISWSIEFTPVLVHSEFLKTWTRSSSRWWSSMKRRGNWGSKVTLLRQVQHQIRSRR